VKYYFFKGSFQPKLSYKLGFEAINYFPREEWKQRKEKHIGIASGNSHPFFSEL